MAPPGRAGVAARPSRLSRSAAAVKAGWHCRTVAPTARAHPPGHVAGSAAAHTPSSHDNENQHGFVSGLHGCPLRESVTQVPTPWEDPPGTRQVVLRSHRGAPMVMRNASTCFDVDIDIDGREGK